MEEMLEQEDDGHGEHCVDCISAEDIDFFRSNRHRLQQQRQELRTKLKSQFLDMQRRLGCASPSCVPCSSGTGEKCGGGSGDGANIAANVSEADKKKVQGVRA